MAIEKEYISVSIQNPTIHNTYDEGRYTTFDVELKTNSLSFTTKYSIVQRRYSDFQWLRKALSRTTGSTPPSLPYGRLFGTFDGDYLNERQKILEVFMQKVVRDTLFVSSAALHLFLQTELNRKDMDSVIKEARRRGSMNAVARAISMYGPRSHRVTSRHSVSNFARSGGGNLLSSLHSPSRSVPQFNPTLPTRHSFASSTSTPRTGSSIRSRNTSYYSESDGSELKGQKDVKGSLKDEEYGDWLILDESSSASRSYPSLNSSAPDSPINSSDYTKVSWTVGDFRGSSESLASGIDRNVARLAGSNRICVPLPRILNNSVNNQCVSQSVGCESRQNTASDTHVLDSGIRRVLSDTNVALPLDGFLVDPSLKHCDFVEEKDDNDDFPPHQADAHLPSSESGLGEDSLNSSSHSEQSVESPVRKIIGEGRDGLECDKAEVSDHHNQSSGKPSSCYRSREEEVKDCLGTPKSVQQEESTDKIQFISKKIEKEDEKVDFNECENLEEDEKGGEEKNFELSKPVSESEVHPTPVEVSLSQDEDAGLLVENQDEKLCAVLNISDENENILKTTNSEVSSVTREGAADTGNRTL